MNEIMRITLLVLGILSAIIVIFILYGLLGFWTIPVSIFNLISSLIIFALIFSIVVFIILRGTN